MKIIKTLLIIAVICSGTQASASGNRPPSLDEKITAIKRDHAILGNTCRATVAESTNNPDIVFVNEYNSQADLSVIKTVEEAKQVRYTLYGRFEKLVQRNPPPSKLLNTRSHISNNPREVQEVQFTQGTLGEALFQALIIHDDANTSKPATEEKLALVFCPQAEWAYTHRILVQDEKGTIYVFRGVILGDIQAVPARVLGTSGYLEVKSAHDRVREVNVGLLRRVATITTALSKFDPAEPAISSLLNELEDYIGSNPIQEGQYESTQAIIGSLITLQLTSNIAWINPYHGIQAIYDRNRPYIQYAVNWIAAHPRGATVIRTMEILESIPNQGLQMRLATLLPYEIVVPLNWVQRLNDEMEALWPADHDPTIAPFIKYIRGEIADLKQDTARKFASSGQGEFPHPGEAAAIAAVTQPHQTQEQVTDPVINFLRQEVIWQLIIHPLVNLEQAMTIATQRIFSHWPEIYAKITPQMGTMVTTQLQAANARYWTYPGTSDPEISLLSAVVDNFSSRSAQTRVAIHPQKHPITGRTIYVTGFVFDAGMDQLNDCFFAAIGSVPRGSHAQWAANLLGADLSQLRPFINELGQELTAYRSFMNVTTYPMQTTELGLQGMTFSLLPNRLRQVYQRELDRGLGTPRRPSENDPWLDFQLLGQPRLVALTIPGDIVLLFGQYGTQTYIFTMPIEIEGIPDVPMELLRLRWIINNSTGRYVSGGTHYCAFYPVGEWDGGPLWGLNKTGQGPFKSLTPGQLAIR
ncbi:MAG: hypothetical protein LBF65_02875 [Holosporales bacterium]|jgi:hypothetical protein|nr:hypothetical protein [Holosporales bacterium]